MDAEARVYEVLMVVMKTMEDENEVDIDAIRRTYPPLNSVEDIIPTMMAIGVARRIEQIGPDSDLSACCRLPSAACSDEVVLLLSP